MSQSVLRVFRTLLVGFGVRLICAGESARQLVNSAHNWLRELEMQDQWITQPVLHILAECCSDVTALRFYITNTYSIVNVFTRETRYSPRL